MGRKHHQFAISVMLCVMPLAVQVADQTPTLEVRVNRGTIVIDESQQQQPLCFTLEGERKTPAKKLTVHSKGVDVASAKDSNQVCTVITVPGAFEFEVSERDSKDTVVGISAPITVNVYRKLFTRIQQDKNAIAGEILTKDDTGTVCFEVSGDRSAVATTQLIETINGKAQTAHQLNDPRTDRPCWTEVSPGVHNFRLEDRDSGKTLIAMSDPLTAIVLRTLEVEVKPGHEVRVEADHATPRVCFRVTRSHSSAKQSILYRRTEFPVPLTEIIGKPGEDLCIGVAVPGTHSYYVYDYMERYDGLQPIARSNEINLTVNAKLRFANGGGNGIAVGRAKLFDDRALRTMYDDVQRALALHQVSLNGIHDRVGRFQGGVENKSFFGINATTIPIPAVTATTTATETANSATHSTTTSTAGNPAVTTTSETGADPTLNRTNTTQTTSNQAAISPGLPTAANPTSPFSFAPTFGQSAQDFLAEETDLAAQAINLRLLLQRALSDRVLLYGAADATPRLTPAIGFQISIDPRTKYQNAVAEAIVTVSSRWAGPQYTPEIVALIPKEKTYNVAKLTNSSNAFNLGAVVQIVNIGANVTRSRNTVYLVKDADTVALEKIPIPDTGKAAFGSVEFGWQFRPVLGEASVSPGIRQVFAVLALPPTASKDWGGIVRVRTQWRRFDPKSKTVIGNKPIRGSITEQEPYFLLIPSLAEQGRATAARIDDLEWHDNGGGKAVVTLDGSFPAGTRLTVADNVIETPTDGMILRTENRISVAVPVSKLVLGPPTLVDPFGVATIVRHPHAQTSDSLLIEKVTSVTPDDATQLRITAQVKVPHDISRPRRTLKQPVVFVGNNVYGVSTGSLSIEPTAVEDTFLLTLTTPLADAKTARTIRVVDLLHGDGVVQEKDITFPVAMKKVAPAELQVLSSDGTKTIIALIGKNFDKNGTDSIRLQVGETVYQPVINDQIKTTFREYCVDSSVLQRAQKIIVTFNDGEPAIFPVPRLTTDRPKIIRHETILEGMKEGVIRLDGLELGSVKRVEYNLNELMIKPVSTDPSMLFINVISALTDVPGEKNIVLITKDDVRLPAALYVQAKPKKEKD